MDNGIGLKYLLDHFLKREVFMTEIEQGCRQSTTEIDKLEEAKAMALKMLGKGVCCSVIANRTGLSKEEIKKLNNHVCDH